MQGPVVSLDAQPEQPQGTVTFTGERRDMPRVAYETDAVTSMSLSDSLMPDRLPERQQDASGAPPVAAPTPIEALYARTDANVDGEFEGIFGPGGPEARAALESAAEVEGQSAYDRFRTDPDAFGMVVGNRERADTVGGALEALNYSKAYHAAEQEGREPVIPGYGTPTEELDLSSGRYDGIYLDSGGNQIGRFGNPSGRLFVVTNRTEADQMRQAWNSHTNTTESLSGPVLGALEIPSLVALHAMYSDITSHSYSVNEVGGLWGVDSSGQSHVGYGGIGRTNANRTNPGSMRAGFSETPSEQLSS